MYVPQHHQFTDPEALQALMQAHPLGAWVCLTPDGLHAHHIPFFLDRTQGPWGTLKAHVARANGVWRHLRDGAPSVVMFQAAQAYVSPNWYPGKVAHGEVVPTWNYVAVHAHGTARVMDDPQWMLHMLDQLTQAQEAAMPTPWSVGDAPEAFIHRMLQGVVGVEISIARLEGKCKASQDEDLPDRLGTVKGLRNRPDDMAHAMARWVEQALPAPKG